jgi:hypothetical protein
MRIMDLNQDQFGYRIAHTPPGPDSAPAHAVDSAMPDYYEHPDYYGGGEADQDAETHAALSKVRGKPNAKVTVYRAAPSHVRDINPGDWVTTSRSYAVQHGRDATDPSKDWPVLSARVKASHLFTNGDSPHEYGFHPDR